MKKLEISLVGINTPLIEAWQDSFAGENVSIIEGDITLLECDAIVSPANSFGFMDGGLDYAISVRLGWELQERLQKIIKELPEGELLVGRVLIIETFDQKIPYLISAPTMRVPTNFNIPTSVNAYLAMKAILIAAMADERIHTIAIPGLCAGCGRMLPEIAARQMYIAYKEIVLGEKMKFNTFGEAQTYQLGINPEGKTWTH
jgi:O-acetyl-ADP-ribose deacetylase (regulator of RNase III)